MQISKKGGGYTDLAFVNLLVNLNFLYLQFCEPMALHTKKDFALICGIKLAALSTYAKRDKVICSGDYIDDAIEKNAAFMEKWRAIKQPDVPAPALNGKPRDERRVVAKPIDNTPPPKPPNIKPPSEFTFAGNQIDAEIKRVELDRKLEDLEIAKLKRQKMAGESMPTDLVKNTISVYSRSVSRSFNNAADNLLVEFQTMSDISREQVSSMRTKLNAIVNKAINDAYENAIDMVDNIVDEYSETRGKGDRLS
jgi:hypothetical protein